MLKRCFKCQCEKPLDDFYKHSRMGDGRLNKCKECTKKDVLEHRLANLAKVRAYDRMRGSMPHRVAARAEYAKTAAYQESHKATAAKWQAKHPERKKATVAVNNAVRDGRLKKQPCWVCGDKAQAHHPDYSRPLDVVWLCPPHHKQTHKLVANPDDMRKAA
jgi:hypothetical protein